MYAIKLELEPTKSQLKLLAGCAGFRRVVYNFGLDLVKASWSWGIKMSDSKILDFIKKVLTNDTMNHPEYSWMREYSSTIYQSAFQDLKDAFKRYRDPKLKAKMPRVKKKGKNDSFTVYKTSGVYTEKGKPALPFTNRVVLKAGKKIALPGLGEFKLKEGLGFTCSSQTFTVSRKAGRWLVAFTIAADRLPPLFHPVVERVGIDLGIKTFATLSDGTTYDLPESLKKAITKLKEIQYKNRKKCFGDKRKGIKVSNRAKRFLERLAKQHTRIANIRYNFLQETTTKISKRYSRICIEDLNISGMLANRKLSKAISNLGAYEFRRQLAYKQSIYSTELTLADRWFPSSKMCSCCQSIKSDLALKDRIYECFSCGLILDRDLNASLNLAKY